MSDATVIGPGFGPPFPDSDVAPKFTFDLGADALLTPIDSPSTPLFPGDDRATKRRKKRREKERDDASHKDDHSTRNHTEHKDHKPSHVDLDNTKEQTPGQDRPHRHHKNRERDPARSHTSEQDRDQDRERRRRKKVIRQASGLGLLSPDHTRTTDDYRHDLGLTPPPSSSLDGSMRTKKKSRREDTAATMSSPMCPQVVTTLPSTDYSSAYPLTPITPGMSSTNASFSRDPDTPDVGPADDDDDDTGSVIVHRAGTTFSVRHVSEAGESTVSSLPSELHLGDAEDQNSKSVTLALSPRTRAGKRISRSDRLRPDSSHARWSHAREVSLVICKTRDEPSSGRSGIRQASTAHPTNTSASAGAGPGLSEQGGSGSRPNNHLPLVLLHVTILIPPTATYSDRVLTAARVPPEIQANFRLLRDRLSEHVLLRGLLVSHSRDDYDLLEERILESLDLMPPSAGRLVNGQFWTPNGGAPVGGQRRDMCTHRPIGLGIEDANSNEDERCPDCARFGPLTVSSRDGGSGSYRWDVNVYAANGLLRSTAWAAAWREMESVDVEIAPWVSTEMRNDLELARRDEEEEQERLRRPMITDGSEALDEEAASCQSHRFRDDHHGPVRSAGVDSLNQWASGEHELDTSTTEVDSVASASVDAAFAGKPGQSSPQKSTRRSKAHSVKFVDTREEIRDEPESYADDESDVNLPHDMPEPTESAQPAAPKPLGVLFKEYIAFKLRDQRLHAVLLGLFTIWLTLYFTGAAGIGVNASSKVSSSLHTPAPSPSSSASSSWSAASSSTSSHPNPVLSSVSTLVGPATRSVTLTLIGTLTETIVETQTVSTTATVTDTATYLSVTTMTEVRTQTSTEKVTSTRTSVSTVTETERYTTTHTKTRTQTHIHTFTATETETKTMDAPPVMPTRHATDVPFGERQQTVPMMGQRRQYVFDSQIVGGMCDPGEMSCLALSSCLPVVSSVRSVPRLNQPTTPVAGFERAEVAAYGDVVTNDHVWS